MDSDQFDALATRLSTHLTRRRSLGALGVLGIGSVTGPEETDAKKKKKKKKCKGGTKKCNGKCIPSTNCCTSTECGAGASCRNGTCTTPTTSTTPVPDPCAGKPDGVNAACGTLTHCNSPLGVCGKACSGGVCAQLPTCNGSVDPCGVTCCDPAGAACNSFPNPNHCGCSGVDNPCYSSDDCCGPGICVGFVCRLPQ